MDNLSIGVILAQLINFGIIFYIFYYFLGKKIVEGINSRRELIKSLKDSKDESKKALEEALNEAKKTIEDAKLKASEIQNSAMELSKKQSEAKLQEAELKAKNILDGALRDIEKERLSMAEQLKNKILDISLKINSKILNNEESNKEFIKKEITGVKL
ncbi:MAG: ATP synthase F0 subunit B [Candidatus Gracilibacteria bacterium]|nr:ATP synthase F0 subunit B [Candidatus Gracilibacteria bacterium]